MTTVAIVLPVVYGELPLYNELYGSLYLLSCHFHPTLKRKRKKQKQKKNPYKSGPIIFPFYEEEIEA